MPAKLNDRVCRLYAETFAADLMLLMNRIDSPGLLVRPRPGRTELCGEYIEDEPLAAAAAFVAGSTRACAAAVRRNSASSDSCSAWPAFCSSGSASRQLLSK